MSLPVPLPLYVAQTESGAEVRLRFDDSVLSTHDGLVSALDALLADPAFQAKGPDGKPRAPLFADGVWRWLDASAEEPAAAGDGSQVTREAIATMAARLNSQASAVMIDGGTADSGAHQSLSKTDTRSNGWAHVGAEVLDASGRWHLYLRCEVLPAIAPDLDSNRIAYGSIGFAQSTADLADATLLQHALTNIPAVDGLTPAGSVRARRSADGRVVARRTHRMEIDSMTTKSKRGAAADALTKLFAMFGLDASDDDAAWKLHDAVHALKNAAAAESAIDALSGGGAPAAEPAAASTPARAKRAVDGLEGAGLETVATQLRDAARIALGMPDATLQQAAESMAAKAEAIAEAMKPGEDEGAPAPEGEENMTEKTTTGADAVRSRLEKMDEAIAAVRAENAALKAREARRALEERITLTFRSAELDIDATERAQLADAMGECSEGAATRLLDTEVKVARSKAPPTGALMSRAAPASSRSAGAADANEAIALATQAVRSESPALRGPEFFKAVTARARKDHPAAFSRSAS